MHALSFDWDVLVRRAEFNAARVAAALAAASRAAHHTATTVAAAANNALGGNVQVQHAFEQRAEFQRGHIVAPEAA